MLGLVFYQTTKGSSPVERYLRDQGEADRALLLEKLKAFCEEFPTLLTVSVKPLRGKIWEIRAAGTAGRQHRLLYAVVGREIVVLHAFTKKTQKTPPRDLKLAERRFREMTS
jgi:phage-related protein